MDCFSSEPGPSSFGDQGDEGELTLVVSCHNELNAEYLKRYMDHKYEDEYELEVLSREEFESKYGYCPATQAKRRKLSETAQTPLVDRSCTESLVCQHCGEELRASKKPEWAVKAKHILLHLQYDIIYSCLLCQFTCPRPVPMFKHIPIAHNNKMETHLYPVFKSSTEKGIFDGKIEECFPGTACHSMLQEDVDTSVQLPSYAVYYKVSLVKKKDKPEAPIQLAID